MALCEVEVLLVTLNYNLCSNFSNQIHAVSSKLKLIGIWAVRCNLPFEQFNLGAFCRIPTVQVLKSIVIQWASLIANMRHPAGPHSRGRYSNITN